MAHGYVSIHSGHRVTQLSPKLHPRVVAKMMKWIAVSGSMANALVALMAPLTMYQKSVNPGRILTSAKRNTKTQASISSLVCLPSVAKSSTINRMADPRCCCNLVANATRCGPEESPLCKIRCPNAVETTISAMAGRIFCAAAGGTKNGLWRPCLFVASKSGHMTRLSA